VPLMPACLVCSHGVDMCAGLEQVLVGDNNLVTRLRAVLYLDEALYKHHVFFNYFLLIPQYVTV
jgi:hypothetical protein